MKNAVVDACESLSAREDSSNYASAEFSTHIFIKMFISSYWNVSDLDFSCFKKYLKAHRISSNAFRNAVGRFGTYLKENKIEKPLGLLRMYLEDESEYEQLMSGDLCCLRGISSQAALDLLEDIGFDDPSIDLKRLVAKKIHKLINRNN